MHFRAILPVSGNNAIEGSFAFDDIAWAASRTGESIQFLIVERSSILFGLSHATLARIQSALFWLAKGIVPFEHSMMNSRRVARVSCFAVTCRYLDGMVEMDLAAVDRSLWM